MNDEFDVAAKTGLSKVNASHEESSGPWQQSIAYKVLPPDVKKPDQVDLKAFPTIQEQPVNSAITSPGLNFEVNPDEDETIDVAGYAFSGGGQNIQKVEVSSDGGKTWSEADLGRGSEQPPNKAWAWTHWTASLPIPSGAASMTVCCRALDINYNSQPASPASVWNLRGLNGNACHCRSFSISQ